MTDRQEGGTRQHGKLKPNEPGKALVSIITATCHDARLLPDAMWRLWTQRDVQGDNRMAEQARNAVQQRREAFAEKYQDIVLCVSCGGLL